MGTNKELHSDWIRYSPYDRHFSITFDDLIDVDKQLPRGTSMSFGFPSTFFSMEKLFAHFRICFNGRNNIEKIKSTRTLATSFSFFRSFIYWNIFTSMT